MSRFGRSASVAALIVPVVAIMSLLIHASPARAELELCNKTGYPVELAIGYSSNNRWVSEGWWTIAGGGCQVVVRGDLKERYYYYYAEHRQVGGTWGGSYPFCVSRNRFTIVGDKNCQSRGYEQRGFKQIDTRDARSARRNLTD